MNMKKTFLIIATLTMLVSCGGGASAPKEDEAGHNPRPSQIVSDTMQANVGNPVDMPYNSDKNKSHPDWYTQEANH